MPSMDALTALSEEATTRRSSGPVWLMTTGMGIASVLLLWIVDERATHHATPLVVPWWVLAIAFGLTEARAMNLRFGSESYSYTLTQLVLVIGLFAASPNGIVLAQFAGTLVVLAVVLRRLPCMLAFTLAHRLFSTIVAVTVFSALAGSVRPLEPRCWLAAFGAVAAMTAVSTAVTWLGTFLMERPTRCRDVLLNCAFALVFGVVNTMVALVGVIEYVESPAATLLLVAPILMVFVAYRAYLSERSKSDALLFLYTASEVLNHARDLDTGLVALLEFARTNFRADLAEIVLRGEPGEQFGYRSASGPGDALSRLEPVAIARIGEVIEIAARAESTEFVPEPGSALAVRRGLSIGSLLITPFHDDSGPRGALLLARSTEEEPFGKDDARLFETFANHVGLSLEKELLTSTMLRLRKAEQELAYQAYHDSLTGLANRALFRDRVDAAIAESLHDGCRIGVMFIDLDDFKTVNDTKGHAAGDALLVEVSARLSQCVGSRDTAARIGGDEFALLLRDVSHISQVHLIANSIIRSLREPIEIDGEPIVSQASIGVALHTFEAGAAELMQQADVAMYNAKRNGKGRYEEYQQGMSLTVAHRHQLKVGLERAIVDDEFTLEYQPVMDIGSGGITGAEALVRWRDPERGLQQPDEFVGLAEETGVIVPIGRLVVQAACRQATEWVADHPDLRIFVNLSARELAHPDIVHDVGVALDVSGLDASRLVLEVAETALMRDIDEAKRTLEALKRLGVQLAIDDFGTGLCSLSYLRALPIDVLKIAKPIIERVCDSPQDEAFLRGIIELGHVFGARVVAKGVESVEQHSRAISVECDYAQGYYYARPMSAEELTSMLRTSDEAGLLLGQLTG